MSRVKKIIIVCTGNSCRSVMAAGLLKKMLKRKDDYKIMTAGIAAVAGMLATKEAIQVMSEQDIDIREHRSSPLRDEIIHQADLILVMERKHMENILSRVSNAKDKVFLLNEFGRVKGEDKLVDPDIPDPIGKPLDFYRKVLEIIRESIMRTVRKLEEI